MNYSLLSDAYTVKHINENPYNKIMNYSLVCIYCKFGHSISLLSTDGGSFRQCMRCKKNFRAAILDSPVTNYKNSTYHLRGTN